MSIKATRSDGMSRPVLGLGWMLILIMGAAGCGQCSHSGCSGSRGAHRSVGGGEGRGAGQPFTAQRKQMVAEQIAARGVEDEQVLKAMRTVPRHRFVDEMFKDSAYADHPLSIGRGQTISQPYIVAYMTEALGVDENDKVLEVGTGSGYQAAVLAEIVDQVYTIEIVKPLALRARRILQNLGYKNISFRIGDGYRGWPKAAPFDGIMVTAAPDHVPRPLLEQLAVGGRLVMPVGNALVRITRTKSGYKKQRLLGVRFVPMTGEAQNPRKPAR